MPFVARLPAAGILRSQRSIGSPLPWETRPAGAFGDPRQMPPPKRLQRHGLRVLTISPASFKNASICSVVSRPKPPYCLRLGQHIFEQPHSGSSLMLDNASDASLPLLL